MPFWSTAGRLQLFDAVEFINIRLILCNVWKINLEERQFSRQRGHFSTEKTILSNSIVNDEGQQFIHTLGMRICLWNVYKRIRSSSSLSQILFQLPLFGTFIFYRYFVASIHAPHTIGNARNRCVGFSMLPIDNKHKHTQSGVLLLVFCMSEIGS